jgi:hypothetical protein
VANKVIAIKEPHVLYFILPLFSFDWRETEN